MSRHHFILIRKLQYRIQRQGMLELDTWLTPLTQALATHDDAVIKAVEKVIQYEVPDLIAMQTGAKPIPKELKPWLSISV